MLGCAKEAPPDPHVQQGYALLRKDPQAALAEFDDSRDPQGTVVSFGRGLALEGLRRYQEAERVLGPVGARGGDPAVFVALARVQLMQGKLSDAQRSIDQAVAKAPSDASVLLVEACLASDVARAQRALAHLDALSGSALSALEVQLARVSLLRQTGNFESEKQALDRVKGTTLGDADEGLALTVLAVASNRVDLAVDLLDRVVSSRPSWTTLLRAGELAHRLGQHALTARALSTLTGDEPGLIRLRARHEYATRSPGAVSSLRAALRVTDDVAMRSEFRLALAEALLRAGDFEAARKEAEMLAKEPTLGAAPQVLMARIDLAAGEAQRALERVLPLLVDKVPQGAREVAGLARVELGQLELAEADFRALLTDDPQHYLAARWLVARALQVNDKKRAVAILSDAVQRAPRDVTLRSMYVAVLRETQAPARVLEALTQATRDLPEQPQIWVDLANEHQRQKGGAAALAVLQVAHEKNPQEPLITAALAATLTRLGRNAEAAPLYEKVLERAEDDPVALNNLAMFHVDHLGNAQRGVELAERAQRLLPREPAIVDTLAWTLYRRGTPEDLKRAYELLTLVEGKFDSATYRFHLGAVCLAIGQTEQGRRLLREALASGDGFPEAEQARQLLDRGS